MNHKNTTNKKPVIGISMRFNIPNRHLYLPSDYAEAVEWAGGVPVHLSLLPRNDYNKTILSLVDGILLPGGADIDPLRYGEEPKPGLGTVSPLRDENDLVILSLAEEMNIPVLGICYGMQLLNVYRGGGIVQDIEREIPNSLKHQQGEPRERLSHWINISEKSLLFKERGENKVLVNSHHHQAVERIGKNLFVSATASDGIVEAIEDTRPDRFNLGVQWHPEICFRSDELSKQIFCDFIAAAGKERRKYN
ncbi:MAG: gamma-glutamyl-gamma-aminobutyrate hydrolase family protein [Acidobacteriota bacterium]|nr:gamma-glutamyl-gamma-aminobutyrate hydrolase family protein [Acidobacteriota bacterium]